MNILKAQTIVKLPNVGCCNFMSRSLRVLFLLDFVSIPFYFVFLANSPRLRLKLFASSFQFIFKSNPSQICSYNLHPSLKSLLLTLYLSISLSLYLSISLSLYLSISLSLSSFFILFVLWGSGCLAESHCWWSIDSSFAAVQGQDTPGRLQRDMMCSDLDSQIWKFWSF